MKKIIFGITGLTLGGAERTLVDIANRLCYRYEVTIFCLYSKGELEKELSDKIKLIHLCKKSNFYPKIGYINTIKNVKIKNLF